MDLLTHYISQSQAYKMIVIAISIAANGGNMASKANHRTTPLSTKLTWLLCYIACYVLAHFQALTLIRSTVILLFFLGWVLCLI